MSPAGTPIGGKAKVEDDNRDGGDPGSVTSGSGRAKAPEEEDANEHSPLLSPRDSYDQDLDDADPTSSKAWALRESQKSKSVWYMVLLTLSGLGLQMGWSVEMSNGSPYLLSLGLSKTLLALVWIAGPLSGVLVQPFVGHKSDRSRIKYGKRRPFMIGGALATVLSLIILAWAREIVSGFLGLFGADPSSRGVAVAIMSFAVLFIYVLDFAINVFQAALRAYIVDCAPTHQQDTANAWVSRTSGVGNIIGMMCSGSNLPEMFPFLGNSQFKVLCAIASIAMVVTVFISCVTIPERDPSLDGELPADEKGVLRFFRSLLGSVLHLPPQIARVCEVQFLAWMGWFPFLFYTTTYIGEIYVAPYFEANPNLSPAEVDELWEEGTRRGGQALLVFAVTTFLASVFLPFITPPAYEPPEAREHPDFTPLTPTGSTSSAASPQKASSSSFARAESSLNAMLSRLQIPGLTLRRAWLLSHVLFALCMLLTFVVRSTALATVLVGIIGVPWALTQWVPFALVSAEVSKREAIRQGIIRPPPTTDGALLAANEDDKADQAGVVLGIHNVAISAPQVIATLVSSLIFSIAAKPRGAPGDESVAWCMRFGGLCAIGAAILTKRVHETDEGPRGDGKPEERRLHAGED